MQGFSEEQMARINALLPAYFDAELAKWMSGYSDKAQTHRLVKYPDDTVETATGITFRRRYILMANDDLGDALSLDPFEIESASYPHTTLAVTIEKAAD